MEKKCTYVLDRTYSDHCPLLLKESIMDWGPKPFKVFDCWLKDNNFEEFVKSEWRKIEIEV